MTRFMLSGGLLACALLAGCSDRTPSPKPGSALGVSPPGVSPPGVSPSGVSTPKGTQARPPSKDPTPETVFADTASCQQAHYTVKQCQMASGIAEAMSRQPSTVYSTARDCARFFQNCTPRKSGEGKEGFFPRMKGFSLGDDIPGVDAAPSPTHPVFYSPVYKNLADEWVYLLEDAHGGLLAKRVLPASLSSSSPPAPHR